MHVRNRVDYFRPRNTLHYITRNTFMQRPLAYIFQTLFQHEVFVIMPTLNAGSRCTSCQSWQDDNCFCGWPVCGQSIGKYREQSEAQSVYLHFEAFEEFYFYTSIAFNIPCVHQSERQVSIICSFLFLYKFSFIVLFTALFWLALHGQRYIFDRDIDQVFYIKSTYQIRNTLKPNQNLKNTINHLFCAIVLELTFEQG